jgi:hypothetical protein
MEEDRGRRTEVGETEGEMVRRWEDGGGWKRVEVGGRRQWNSELGMRNAECGMKRIENEKVGG